MTDEQLRVHLLGRVRAERGGAALSLGGPRRAALLALLAVAAPRRCSRGALVDGLWGQHPPEHAGNAVQVHVAALRRVLGRGAVITEGDGYRLSDEVWVDVRYFVESVAVGRACLGADEPASAASTLRHALELWTGPAFEDAGRTDAFTVEVARLEGLRLEARLAAIEAGLRLGQGQEHVAELESLVTANPLNEQVWELSMRALDQAGRPAEALVTFERARRLLRHELGTVPSARLRAMHHVLLSRSGEQHLADAGVCHRYLLPQLPDETFGRADDLDRVEAMLLGARGRLVTIVGTGGVGKTRLAVELAHRLTNRFAGGVVFASLADAEKPDDVAAVVCSVMGVTGSGGERRALVRALTSRSTVLVCDNFEHVVDAADLLAELLDEAPGLRILVTSRRPLGLRAERQYRLEPLPCRPDGEVLSPAAQLFVARVRAADPGFVLSAGDFVAVEEICARCDGLPLGVELAAGRAGALTLTELKSRLESVLAMLSASTGHSPARHRSMRANIAWSVDDLPPAAERILCCLAVFHGGATLAAVAEVADMNEEAVLPHLELLLDRSLIRRTRQADSGSLRFTLLEVIREYARELVGDQLDALRDRHAMYFRTWVEPRQGPSFHVGTASRWRAWREERGNLRSAARWTLTRPAIDVAADLVLGIAGVWGWLSPREGLVDWLTALHARTDLPRGRRADVAFYLAWAAEDAGDPAGMSGPLDEGLRIAAALEDAHRLAWLISLDARRLSFLGEHAAARERAAQAWRIAEPLTGAHLVQVWVLEQRALIEAERPDGVARAVQLATIGLSLLRAHGEDLLTTILLGNLSEFANQEGRADDAAHLAEEGIMTIRGLGLDDEVLSPLLGQRGYARLLLGDSEDAVRDLRLAFHGDLVRGITVGALYHLVLLAGAAATTWPACAAEYLGVVDAALKTAGTPAQAAVRARYLTQLPDVLGHEAYQRAHEEGSRLVAELGVTAALQVIDRDLVRRHAGG